VDKVYLRDPAGVELLPGGREAIRAWRQAGYLVVLVTNQSGVGRGMVSEAEVAAQHERLAELLGADAALDGIYICPHHPDANCECRKPKPSLLLSAAAELSIDLAESWMIGDKPADVDAGLAAGCRTIQIARSDHPNAHHHAADLASAVALTLSHTMKS
jgi:D-glycero-D-manno-heptose 1,7-bisphosphate phosphatase